jgi:hypothetical protein
MSPYQQGDPAMAYQVEITDTFGGEANYSWVRRYLIDNPTSEHASRAYRRDLVKRAKAAAGWTGRPCTTYWDSYMTIIRPKVDCQIMFITYHDPIMDDLFRGEDLRCTVSESCRD